MAYARYPIASLQAAGIGAPTQHVTAPGGGEDDGEAPVDGDADTVGAAEGDGCTGHA